MIPDAVVWVWGEVRDMAVIVNKTACFYVFFFFNDTATTEIYTLSLHELFRSGKRLCLDRRRRGRGDNGRLGPADFGPLVLR